MYDKLQKDYGAKELDSIYFGGCTDNPDVFFVFMNPTGKNIASNKNWKGLKDLGLVLKLYGDFFMKLDY